MTSRCICSICLGSLTEDPTDVSTVGPNAKTAKPSNPAQTVQLASPRCGHIFHRACLTTWLTTGNNICPSCRKICGQSALKPVFLTTSQTSSSTTAPSATESLTTASSTTTASTASLNLTTQSRLGKAQDEHEELLEDLDEARGAKQDLQQRHDSLIVAQGKARRTISGHQHTLQQLEDSKNDLSKKLDVETKAHEPVDKELDVKYKKMSDLIVNHLKFEKWRKAGNESLPTKESQSDANQPDDEDKDGDEVADENDHGELSDPEVSDDDNE